MEETKTIQERMETLSENCHDRAVIHSRMGRFITATSWSMLFAVGYFIVSGARRVPDPTNFLCGMAILIPLTAPDYSGCAKRYRNLEGNVDDVRIQYRDNPGVLKGIMEKYLIEKRVLDYRAPWTYDRLWNKMKPA